MSFKASRLPDPANIEQFSWTPVAGRLASSIADADAGAPDAEEAKDEESAEAAAREAFNRGYQQGERDAADAAAARNQAILARLAQTLEELSTFRIDVIRRTERQAVQLVLALAERVVHREITLDRGILVGMARAALDRLGEFGSATIRLHPADYDALSPSNSPRDGRVTVVADPNVARGGCQVQSDFGFMDASPEAQFRELARALLSDDPPATDMDASHGLVAS